MTKDIFYKKVAERADSTVPNARKFVAAVEDTVMEAIALEDKITFTFGTIGGRCLPPCRRGNPRTGARDVELPERHGQPYYRPSKMAKDY